MDEEQPIHETGTEARAGDNDPTNRYVLYASMTLVVIVFIVILAIGWV